MPLRAVDFPGKGKFISAEKAAEWMGVSEKTLDRLVENATVAGRPWVQVKWAGSKPLYETTDIFVLAHLLDRLGKIETQPKKNEPSE